MSMVCGNVLIDVKAPKDETSSMATLELTFFVLSMDKTGHIIWPTAFDAPTQAQLRKQARALLKKMIDDPLNPAEDTMRPALTGTGTSEVWVAPKKRKLVEIDEE